MAKNEVTCINTRFEERLLERQEPKLKRDIIIESPQEEAAKYTSNAITDRWVLTLNTLANMDTAEIMTISLGINELTKLRNNIARRILLVADHVGFTYPNFVTKIFPMMNASNVYYKIIQLKEIGILYPTSYMKMDGEKKKSLAAILRYMRMKGNIGPRQMRNKPDFCEINSSWSALVKKTIKPNEDEKKALRSWERRYVKFK